jgi:PcrA/UvrD helicase-like protein
MFAMGEDVVHPAFGSGKMMDIRGEGQKTELTVNFDQVGTKHLSLYWAPLKHAADAEGPNGEADDVDDEQHDLD